MFAPGPARQWGEPTRRRRNSYTMSMIGGPQMQLGHYCEDIGSAIIWAKESRKPVDRSTVMLDKGQRSQEILRLSSIPHGVEGKGVGPLVAISLPLVFQGGRRRVCGKTGHLAPHRRPPMMRMKKKLASFLPNVRVFLLSGHVG